MGDHKSRLFLQGGKERGLHAGLMGAVPAFRGCSEIDSVADFTCLLLSVSVLGASSSREAVVTVFQLLPFVRGSISILGILIFSLELEDTFSSQPVHPPHFTDETSEPQHM